MKYKIDFIEQPENFSKKELNSIKGGAQCNNNCILNFNNKNEQKSDNNDDSKFRIKFIERKEEDFCLVNVYF
ncbi:hypothetical protein L21SP5_01224 [Salinivirga cyanobacteriivorans]|uniref:Uncharacterized protein n=1 Tax=Salinivirga cyanobacteriivorans TaxID=1307839 RepID=A0A0S2HXU2_9BACT|nr:hypothetical protein [Salinivirga cyanobacteriivorans]ALO14879.1 hypothetical protein L21SP5_01224 [Salinivirga cyanobacteriivorans]